MGHSTYNELNHFGEQLHLIHGLEEQMDALWFGTMRLDFVLFYPPAHDASASGSPSNMETIRHGLFDVFFNQESQVHLSLLHQSERSDS